MLRSAVVFPLETHSSPSPQDHPHPIATSKPSQSSKKLLFKKSSSLSITQSFLRPIIPAKSFNPINTFDNDDDNDVSLCFCLVCTYVQGLSVNCKVF